MRRFLKFLAAALLASAAPLQAQTRVVAAAAHAPSVPLVYQARLLSPNPTLSAGGAFLADGRAQEWFQTNRPELLAPLMQNAYDMKDWEQVLAAHDDPRLLREAILSRSETTLGRDASALLALVDRTPALAAQRPLFEATVMDWGIISAETRGILAEEGFDERRWTQVEIPARYEILRHAQTRWARTVLTAPEGSREYAEQYEKVHNRLWGLSTDTEITERLKTLARAKETAAALEQARDSVSRGAKAAEALGVSAPVEWNPDPRERHDLAYALMQNIAQELRGTKIGGELLASFGEDPVSFSIEKITTGAGGDYTPDQKHIRLSERYVLEVAAALGHTPRSLLADKKSLAVVGKIFASTLVHEGTHHRQFAWARSRHSPATAEHAYNRGGNARP